MEWVNKSGGGSGIEIEMHSRAFAKFRRLAIFWPFVLEAFLFLFGAFFKRALDEMDGGAKGWVLKALLLFNIASSVQRLNTRQYRTPVLWRYPPVAHFNVFELGT